ncbi:dihydropteroate synthase [Portibacter lacus]|uniref:dihydropteroate synthase n=1 Tax=Portibacter lacus TaxID=1099794 RepID=A0AA37SSV9_9BACT|nr:dihydropteroate synthase [Portibacter lacus]GLR17450.1 dihydropteroate synthase [Portibacter lacus]
MKSINANGHIISFEEPKIMGILNVTPDSFYDGNKFNAVDAAILQVSKMITEGVDILDIGAASSRPGAETLTAEEEISRLKPILSEIKNQFPELIISVDTYLSKVAYFAINNGAQIINDISAFEIDSKMLDVVEETQAPYVLMHMKGQPRTMQANPSYESVTEEVLKFCIKKIEQLKARSVKDYIVDPGFGFGKSIDDNYKLFMNLEVFKLLEAPILVGISRKSMIYKLLGITAKESLSATSALHLQSLFMGANILRVHDVKEAKQTIDLYKMLVKHN